MRDAGHGIPAGPVEGPDLTLRRDDRFIEAMCRIVRRQLGRYVVRWNGPMSPVSFLWELYILLPDVSRLTIPHNAVFCVRS